MMFNLKSKMASNSDTTGSHRNKDSAMTATGVTPVQQMLSSCVGAVVTSVIVTPFDVVKVRLQAQLKNTPLKERCHLYCTGYIEDLCCQVHEGRQISMVGPLANQKLPGTVRTFVNIIKNEGVTTLWSGLPPTMAMAIPATMIYFTLYDQIRGHLLSTSKLKEPPLWIPIVAGTMARSINVAIISPLEMIRTKMQSMRISYSQLSQAVKSLVQQRGILAMWHGVGPTYWRDVPFSALYWCNYELFKKQFHQETPTWWFSLIAGAGAGSISAIVTLPFDVVKTQLQVELGQKDSVSRRLSTYSLLRRVYEQNGLKGLYAGLVPRVAKIAPACAIMISTYEHGKQYFQKYNKSNI